MLLPLIITVAGSFALDPSVGTPNAGYLGDSSAQADAPQADETESDDPTSTPQTTTKPTTRAQGTTAANPLGSSFRYNFGYGGLTSGAASGIRLGGSYALSGPWIIVGRFEHLGEEVSIADVDVLALSAGAGYVHPYAKGLDFVGTFELEYGRVSASADTGFGRVSGSDSDIGVRARGGARYALESNLEVYGGLGFRTVLDGDLVLDGGARYDINDALIAYVEVEFSDRSVFTLGVQYHF